MQTLEITINPELRDLLPPLSAEELSGLETEILRDGCTDELTLWGNILIDGHHRYEICTRHGFPFKTRQKDFQNLDDAKLWAWQHQANRRNLTDFQRGEIVLKLKDTIAVKAKERQGKRNDLKRDNIPQNSAECKETRQELATLADISHDTLNRIEYISEHADEETKSKLRRGEKGTSINKEYKRLKSDVESKNLVKSSRKSKSSKPLLPSDKDVVPSSSKAKSVTIKSRSQLKDTYCCGVKFEPDPGDTYYDWLTDKERSEFFELQKNCVNPIFPQIRNITIQNIPEHKPDNLITALFGLFSPLYRKKLAYGLLREMYQKPAEKENAVTVVTDLYHEFR
jgi:DNA-binding XRE family transcriptional regulator